MGDNIMDYLFAGNLYRIKKVFKNYNIDIHKGDEHIFRWSCRSNNTEVPKWLLQYSKDIKSPIDIFAKHKNNDAFRVACYYGNLETAKWLWDISCELNSPYDIHLGDDCAFKVSCMNNHYEIAKWLWNLSLKIKSPINIRANDDITFKLTCMYKNLDLANWLCELCHDYQINVKQSGEIEYTIKTFFDKIKENRNDINVLKNLIQNFALLEEYVISNETNSTNNPFCLICMQDNNILFNLKCSGKHNHRYCIDCFCKWFSKNNLKCTHCTTLFHLENNEAKMQRIPRLPQRRDRE